MSVKESIKEFLARGGKITIIPSNTEELETGITIKPTSIGPPALFSLDEAQHFFGKKKIIKKKERKADLSKIDKNKLPKALHHLFSGVTIDEQ